jgi:hypothetical protein
VREREYGYAMMPGGFNASLTVFDFAVFAISNIVRH